MNDKAVIIGVLAVSVALLSGAWYINASRESQVGAAADATSGNSDTTSMQDQEARSKLNIVDTVVGTGKEAQSGSVVFVHYTGKLQDGTIFDSSIPRGEPFSFQLGVGQVIQGWELGITGMKVGGKRTLTIPPELGYGTQAVGSIPSNSTLIFDVELLDVKDAK
jgi:FKBP-type peptidyl-prolyl cis-trans isomerase